MLKQKWISAIPRKNWAVNDSTRICAFHFEKNDFITDSTDGNSQRHNKRNSKALKQARLKSNAVPHIFPHLPNYLSTNTSAPRTTACSSASSRLAKENNLILENCKQMFQEENISDLSLLKEKLLRETLPSGFISIVQETQIILLYVVNISADDFSSPQLSASVKVSANLDLNLFVSSKKVPFTVYQHLITSNKLTNISQLLNILALCKALCANSYELDKSSAYLSLALSFLEEYAALESHNTSSESSLALVKFIVEQLSLVNIPKHGRRYSSSLITTAFLWQLTSSSLYKKLRSLLVLPSISFLRKLSIGMTVQSGTLDTNYLRSPVAELPEQERIVVLMLDEVYTAQRVEYTNGSFIGVTEEGTSAKIVLTFMIQSVKGKYKDVVCLIPIHKLSTVLLRKWFDLVMSALNDLFLVVAVSSDNHVCNR